MCRLVNGSWMPDLAQARRIALRCAVGGRRPVNGSCSWRRPVKPPGR